MDQQRRLLRHSFRLGFPCLVFFFCVLLLTQQIDPAALIALPAELAQLSTLHIVCAALLTAVSLWAAGRYDGVAHRHLNTGIPPNQARVTGSIAIACAQTLGFGLFTGAVARWRMLPDLNLTQALRLSAFVCASFLASWAALTAFACLILPAPTWTTLPALAVLILMSAVLVGLMLNPKIKVGPLTLTLPSLVACGAIFSWTLLDIGAAAFALYVLIPAGDLTFLTFLPVFLIALGAALLSGTPGGVGPFELVLLGMLPQIPMAQMLVGIIGFRAIYYAIPAGIAICAMLRPFGKIKRSTISAIPNMADANRAEIGVIRQNGGMLVGCNPGGIAIWPTAQTLTALGDPIAASVPDAITAFRQHATAQNKIACLYKCAAKTALTARLMGWACIHYADEAVLVPATFDFDRSRRRTLRRKLRNAQNAGVTTTHPTVLPIKDMAKIDADWQVRNGPARGGTMGRFTGAYVAEQLVFLAFHQGQLTAFASFHQSDHQWCLDLMRASDRTPDGTMHALITHALKTAAIRNIAQLSLAATPACPDPSSRLMRAFAVQVVKHSGGPGLRQFKSSFAPRWQPLYVASPTFAGMAIALADIARSVHYPPMLQNPNQPHNQDEDNEVVLLRAS